MTEENNQASPAEAMTVNTCAALLREKFPALFAGKPKPLKLRIQVDINERCPALFTKQTLSAFLRRYTMSDAYLRAVSTDTQRYDLDGQPAGELSEEHRQIAQATLDQRRSKHEDRRAEEHARRTQERTEQRAQEQAQRTARAALLRDFEATTLTRENFCALKGVDPAQLDGLLEAARADRAQRQQFLAELLGSFRESGMDLQTFAEQRKMHPVQLDRLLREASGTPPRPARNERPRHDRQDRPDRRDGPSQGRGGPGRERGRGR